MEIRCPKCKYKFEEEIAPGILEKACVCPRCGTPFIYNVENEDDKNGYDEINSNVDNLYSQNTTTSNDHGKKLHTSQYNGRSSKAKRSSSTSSLQDRYADLRMHLSGKAKQQEVRQSVCKQKRSCSHNHFCCDHLVCSSHGCHQVHEQHHFQL